MLRQPSDDKFLIQPSDDKGLLVLHQGVLEEHHDVVQLEQEVHVLSVAAPDKLPASSETSRPGDSDNVEVDE